MALYNVQFSVIYALENLYYEKVLKPLEQFSNIILILKYVFLFYYTSRNRVLYGNNNVPRDSPYSVQY